MTQGRLVPSLSARGPKPSKRWWLALFAILFVLYNSCSTHEQAKVASDHFADGSWRDTPANLLLAARTLGTDDADALRYFAYCRAALGREYQSYYVRPLSAWLRAFAQKEDDEPDHWPQVVPSGSSGRLVPYRDFLVEYPPGFFLFALPPALLASSGDGFRHLFCSLMGLCLCAGVYLAGQMARLLPGDPRKPLLRSSVLAVLAAGVIATRRYDAAVSLLLCVACWGVLFRWPRWAGIALGVAVATKGTPVFIVPSLALYLVAQRRQRELLPLLLAALFSCLVICLPIWMISGSRLFDAVRYHQQRPLQLESTSAAILGVLQVFSRGPQSVVHSFGSTNLVSRYGQALLALSTVTGILLSIGVLVRLWHRLRSEPSPAVARLLLLQAVVAQLAIFMISGKVFSPQYLIWLLPLGVLVAVCQQGFHRWALLLSLLLGQVIYPASYRALTNLAPWAFGLVLGRNLLLGWWALQPWLHAGPTLASPEARPRQKGQAGPQ